MTIEEFWENEFGNKTSVKDFAGRFLRKTDYRNQNSQSGWDIDHIEPLNHNGNGKHNINTIDNYQIANIATNREKANKTSFTINSVNYQVLRNTPKNISGHRLANYNYKNKRYCIVILEN
jgi:hypothetical protein